MSNRLTKQEIDFIVERLQGGEPLPEDMRYKLFPTRQKEYELAYGGKMRKEDILANEDGVSPAPLQVEKVFNGEREAWPDGWRNMVVFGDNLQFLKTCYQNTDEQIKGKVKGKVKLIYIDPPFATEGDFANKVGAQAYSDKAKGADFVEFLRRRLVVAKELLARDGFIVVHLDYKKGHYIKVLMDEIFGEQNFRNEIYAKRKTKNLQAQFEKVRQLNIASDTLFVYSNNPETRLKVPTKQRLKDKEGADQWNNFFNNADRPTLRYELLGINLPNGQWRWKKERAVIAVNNYKEYKKHFADEMSLYDYWLKTGQEKEFIKRDEGSTRCYYWVAPKDVVNVDTNWSDIYAYDNSPGSYPTQKSEQLLERIISSLTEKGDLIFDFFAGGGTAAVVAEKLTRKWITCDIGKLSFYTVQKRLLNLEYSKDLYSTTKSFKVPAKSFVTLNTGHYDLEKVFSLEQEKYRQFVMNLFEVTPTPGKKVGGIPIDGERADTFLVHIYPYWQFKEAMVDEDYLESLQESIGRKAGNRFYIVAPVNYVGFISDYHEVGSVRFYFLKVPYHIIRELHKQQFKKFRQPQSQKNVNDLEDAIGFHFMRQPTVVSELVKNDSEVQIKLKDFRSHTTEDGTGRDLHNFESLAMVLIDPAYNGKEFCMDTYYFAEDLIPKKKKKATAEDEESDEEAAAAIAAELLQQSELTIPVAPRSDSEAIMAIYVDIYGNEFKEIFLLKK